jgi:hypothetical protein
METKLVCTPKLVVNSQPRQAGIDILTIHH